MYIVVDVETDGPIPGDYSMHWFGAVLVDDGFHHTFEGKLSPISDKWVPEALAVSGVTREETLTFPDPKQTMNEFHSWLKDMQTQHSVSKMRFAADNNGFDWQFINWYFHHFVGENPFGFSSTRVVDLYRGLVKDETASIKHLYKTPHDHNPVNDAMGIAEALQTILAQMRVSS